MNNTAHLQATENLQAEQACKDANLALVLSIVSIYASTIPLLGIATALIAERLAYKTPDIDGVDNIRFKKNVTHYVTPFTFLLSIGFGVFYYFTFRGKIDF